ncbi:type II CAAX endopeptidase family protein [Lentilactobacillus sp. Marseille-Q4993]|uniref:CPBP family intramembrane glutamic endopeptidase n=1 Tax=Lentilactobacillus sp. Marseille-Q4993 TaxID=3039492 RepID=UPI0024BBEEE5|nr:type II CAAX endopeptidase family protein [Lentilactobacillus sp. Marseille-Q4993]
MKQRNLTNYVLNRILTVVKWLALIFVYLFGSGFFTLAGDYANDPGKAQTVLGMGMVITALAIVLVAWLYNRQLKKNNPRSFGRKPITYKKILKLILIFIGMVMFQYFWQILIASNIIHEPANQQAVNEEVLKMPFWNNIFAGLLAPILEEFLFRGIYMNYFFNKNNRLNNILALVVSALLFGFAHELQFDLNWLMYSALGLFLSGTYMYFKDIRFNIALHMMNNLLSLI